MLCHFCIHPDFTNLILIKFRYRIDFISNNTSRSFTLCIINRLKQSFLKVLKKCCHSFAPSVPFCIPQCFHKFTQDVFLFICEVFLFFFCKSSYEVVCV